MPQYAATSAANLSIGNVRFVGIGLIRKLHHADQGGHLDIRIKTGSFGGRVLDWAGGYFQTTHFKQSIFNKSLKMPGLVIKY